MSKSENIQQSEQAFGDAIANRLPNEVDGDIAARLRAARQDAVRVADQRSQRHRWLPVLVPAGGLAATAAAVLISLQSPGVAPLPLLDDQEMAALTELELLEELEMLAWLDDEVFDAG